MLENEKNKLIKSCIKEVQLARFNPTTFFKKNFSYFRDSTEAKPNIFLVLNLYALLGLFIVLVARRMSALCV